jgi:DNA-binding CsgD family transcriptional regulator
MIHGRAGPVAQIDALLAAAAERRSAALLLHGEAGIGKTALLEQAGAAAAAAGLTVLRGVGHESEAEFAFATLDQLLRPLARLMPSLPTPQARALGGALGMSDDAVPDPFLVAAATLSLLAEAAEAKPVLCLVDDLQWADRGSADALVFAARRLNAEGVVMLFAQRTVGEAAPRLGIPELGLTGLGREDALALLRETSQGMDAAVHERVVESSGGNPLALLELPALVGPAASGASRLADPLPVGAGIKRVFLTQVHDLPPDARVLLLVASADPEARLSDVLTVAGALRVDPALLADAEASGLVNVADGSVRFRHPLVRAAVYHDASAVARRRVHEAFARSLTEDGDADRRTWHRSLATSGPDEDLVRALELSAGRARARGALVAACAAMEAAAEHSRRPADAARLLAAAADAAQLAGRPEQARDLIDRAGLLDDDPGIAADLDALRGVLELRTGVPADAHAFLVSAARHIADEDPVRAIELLTDAGQAASYAGDIDLVVATGRQTARLIPRVPVAATLPALVLVGAGKVVSGEAESGRADCRRAADLAASTTDPQQLTFGAIGAQYAGDEALQHALAARAVASARSRGAVAMLPYALEFLGLSELSANRLTAARAVATEGLTLARELRQENSIGRHLAILAWTDAVQGRETPCREQSAEALSIAARRGLGLQAAFAHWALGLLELTLGRPDAALARLSRLRAGPGEGHPSIALSAAVDLVEAAIRCGEQEHAATTLAMFDRFAGTSGPPWAMALSARGHALLAEGPSDTWFTRSLTLHEQASRPLDRARTQLLYGEHLRRTRRRIDARPHLRAAAETFEALGALPWAERAQRELRATGETTRRREGDTLARLTPQEFQIAGLVTQGASNRTVAAQLFLSPRTVEYHLGKVYTKLGVASRAELVGLEMAGPEAAVRA